MSNLKDQFLKDTKSKNYHVHSFESNHYHTLEDKYLGKPILAKEEHISSIPNMIDHQVFSVQNLNTNVFTVSSRFELNVPNQSCDVLEGCPTLLVKFENSDATNSVTSVPLPDMFERIELVQGNLIHMTCTAKEIIRHNLMEYTTEERLCGIDTNINLSPVAIAALGKQELLCKLPFFFENNEMFMGKVNDFKFVFYSKPSVSAGTGVLVCKEVSLLWQHRHLHGGDLREYVSHYDKFTIMHRHLQCMRIQNTMSLAANNSYKVSLQSVAGNKIAYCVVYIVAAGATNTSNASNTFVSLHNATDKTGDLMVLNGQNQDIMMGGYKWANTLFYKQQNILNKGLQNVKYYNDNNVYIVAFAKDIHAAKFAGVMDGYLYIHDNELYQIQIDTPTGLSTANYDVFIDVYVYRHLFLCNGNFKVQH